MTKRASLSPKEAKIAIRQPPLFEEKPGRCRWCGESIEIRLKKDGNPYKRQANYHADCYREYWNCCNPSEFYKELIERDGRKCGNCGKGGWENFDVDHKVPLWKVAHMPREQRLEYFKLGNLWLLCNDPCHKRKSAKEAAERAKSKRLERKRMGTWPETRHPIRGWRKFNGEAVSADG